MGRVSHSVCVSVCVYSDSCPIIDLSVVSGLIKLKLDGEIEDTRHISILRKTHDNFHGFDTKGSNRVESIRIERQSSCCR